MFIFASTAGLAKLVRRYPHMVCKEYQYAYYNVEKKHGVCCDEKPIQLEDGTYTCPSELPEGECWENSDCGENSVCVYPARQCVTCVDGYTTYCARLGEVFIDEKKYTGCTEAACMAGSCEQVWYKQNPSMGYCCTGDAAAYCSVETEECSQLACCDGNGYRNFITSSRFCCTSDKTVTSFGKVQACCTENQKPFCSEYDADGDCIRASCCSETTTSFGYSYYEDGSVSGGFCCSGAVYRSSLGKDVSRESCCASPKIVSDPFKGGIQACCSADQVSYCRNYDENGDCTETGCCSGTLYCASLNADGNCIQYACCSGEVGTWGNETHCCSTGTPYCLRVLPDGTCADSIGCCAGKPYETERGYFACCSSGSLFSKEEFDGLTCCDSDDGYCSSYKNGVCQTIGCCSPGAVSICSKEDSCGCCSSPSVISDDFDGLKACCASDRVPYCELYDENGKCLSVVCGAAGCTPYQKSEDRWECCPSHYTLFPWGNYFICSYEEPSEVSCPDGLTVYQATPLKEGCCEVDEHRTLTREFDGLQACCYYPSDVGFCGKTDLGDKCLSVGCCETQSQVYKSQPHEWRCCYSSYVVSGNFDGLQGCCDSTETPYCYETDSRGKCTSVSCCRGDVYRVGNTSQETCCYEGSHIYQATPTSRQCCPNSIMGNFDGVQACCSEGGTAYCSEYDEEGHCKKADCCYGGSTAYCSAYGENGHCQKAGCCSGNNYCSSWNWDGSCKGESCCVNGTVYQHVSGHPSCCSNYNNHVLNIDDDGIQVCCDSAYEGAYCSERDANGQCTSASCCNGTVYQSAPNVEKCCTQVVSGNFDGLQGCCSSSQTPYCSAKDDFGKCKSVGCCSGTFYQSTQGVEGCCSSSSIISGDFDGLQGCCPSGWEPYCYFYDEGICQSVSCCSSGQTPYRDTQTSMRCCSSSYQVSGDFDGLQACHSEGTVPYCRSYDADGKCTSTSACRSGYVPYRSSSTGSVSCCKSALVRDVGDGIGVCLSSDSYVPYCSSYDSNGTCLRGSYCSSGQIPYRYSQTSASCCSNIITESFEGLQACVQPGYTRAYCSAYVNGRCNKVSVSYIAGGCIPYRISATKGGCCTGTVVKNGDYELCL